jgi:hypothetical protein
MILGLWRRLLDLLLLIQRLHHAPQRLHQQHWGEDGTPKQTGQNL